MHRSHPETAVQPAHPEREITMHLDKAADHATAVADLYDRLNLQQRGRTWSRQDFVLGFVGDVGDLAKLTMATDGTRHLPGDIKAKLEHELADCLFSVLVIARLYDVDLESAFTEPWTTSPHQSATSWRESRNDTAL